MKLIEKVFGTHSERELKLIYPIVDKIVAMRPEMMALSDEDLRDNTRQLKERLEKGETLSCPKRLRQSARQRGAC